MTRPPIDDRSRVEKLRAALPKLIEQARGEGDAETVDRLTKLQAKVARALGED